MAKISKQFISAYLNNRLLEAIRPLNEVKDALDASEQGLKDRIDSIVKEIISIEV